MSKPGKPPIQKGPSTSKPVKDKPQTFGGGIPPTQPPPDPNGPDG